MSEPTEKTPPGKGPRSPGTSPLWWASAGGMMVIAFVVGLWFDRQDPVRGSGPALPAGHPPLTAERPPPAPATGFADYDKGDAEAVWTESCAVCHGTNGEATEAARKLGTPDLLGSERIAGMDDAEIERIIREGNPPIMPSYDLPDATVRTLVDRVRQIAATP